MIKMHKKNENGQAFVEFAIILPILLLILCGIIDFGWIFTNQNIIDHAAREGARYAIINAEGTDAITSIISYTKSITPSNISDSLNVTVVFTNPDFPRLGDVTVLVDRDTEILTPIVGVFMDGQKINLTSNTRMKVE